MIGTVVKKELRGYFNSAVAVVFLAAFLGFALYTFFWQEKFFARGLADLRPLFEWMPKLLIVLVAALSMRLWSDERRSGTLEVLLTLPVPRWQLVLGKFLAGLVLMALALVLTFGLPITIAKMGRLDWGPVVGGYLAALLLSAAYLSIGMCVSAATDNQLVAFVGTALACAVAYAIGETGSDLGRALGTGAHFDSVARGVLDLRDLAYYGGIVAVGIALNVLLLQRVGWASGPRGRARRAGALLGVGLVLANAIALPIWLAPVRRARIDLTQDGTYSLSSATKRILAGLDERLLIRGYFSAKTHPELARLIPQIKDLLEEYAVAGNGKVRVEFVDPSSSDAAAREAKERFNLDPTPLRLATETEKSVINAYFAVAVAYGDQTAVLGLDQLIDVRVLDIGQMEITLGNLEYELTRTIKKTVADFSSVDALFASTSGPIKLTAYITPSTLPDNLKEGPAMLQTVVDKLSKRAGGKLTYATVEPKTEDEMKQLFEQQGLRPYAELLSNQVYYFHLLLQVGNRTVRIEPPEKLSESDLEKAITDGLKRAAPGFSRVVGMWVPPTPPPMPEMEGMPPQRMPPPQSFENLRRQLSASYEVKQVELASPVPDDVEVLVLAGPADLDPKAAEYVDQFVMRGGALVALDGHYRLSMAGQGLSVEKVNTGLDAMLKAWGITVGDAMVMDTKSDALPIPQERDLGNGMIVRELHQMDYPFFVKVDGDQLASSNLITSGLTGAVMHWTSPVKADAKVGDDTHKVVNLLRSSSDSWQTTSTDVNPNLRAHPGLGFPGPSKELTADQRGKQVLAVAVTGGFATSVPKPPAPPAPKPGEPAPAPPAEHPRIEHSPPDTRVVVFGSSAFVSDDMLQVAQQLDADLALSNLQLVHNAVDWALADTDLLSIRGHDAHAHALTLDADRRDTWRDLNIVIAFVGLGLVVAIAWLRRRSVRPITAVKA
ncbi:MAG TPA: Gldg family protein [Kofleriaceae bacterium]|nr:Gldg family protein [Kofleriaceae bacterium]